MYCLWSINGIDRSLIQQDDSLDVIRAALAALPAGNYTITCVDPYTGEIETIQ